MEKSKIAVFIDVENLTQWVKEDGTETLMADLAMEGQIIVRRDRNRETGFWRWNSKRFSYWRQFYARHLF